MSKYWETSYYEQPGTKELQKNAAASKKKEKKKGNILEPVVVQGRNIVTNWWGKAWCQNLEQYADYENRLDRGKRYVRTGSVIDLKIQRARFWPEFRELGKCPIKLKSELVLCQRKSARTLLRSAEEKWKIWRNYWQEISL